MKCPCKDCFDRTVTCHVMCTRYKAWKKWREEMAANKPEHVNISRESQRIWWRNMKTRKKLKKFRDE